MCSPAVKVPVSRPPQGYSETCLELLGARTKRTSTKIWCKELEEAAMDPFMAELIQEIGNHDARSSTSLTSKLHFICRRYDRQMPQASIKWLKQCFPYIAWNELLNISSEEA